MRRALGVVKEDGSDFQSSDQRGFVEDEMPAHCRTRPANTEGVSARRAGRGPF
jgi:hypothetical protein